MSGVTISPFKLSIPDSTLSDLKYRLASVRWPEKETVNDKSQGVPLDVIQDLCKYWHDEYDWRPCEKWINEAGSFKADIDGYSIHFLHIRSKHENALPLLLLHGWPGSILEFRKAAEFLTDPTSHEGGSASDAFHLIIPAMPGYGFSDRPASTGTNFRRMGRLYIQLMEVLGYTSWVAQGGDFGADICAALAAVDNNPPKSLAAVHLNCMYFDTDKEISSDPSDDEKLAAKKNQAFTGDDYAYFKQQATRPQTIGYSLADSPVAQAAWIYEKLQSWTQNDGDVQAIFTKDQILDNIMLYWLPNTGASSARLYWEEKDDTTALKIDVPIGVTQFAGEHGFVPKLWAERYYSDIIHWGNCERGGHFPAWEVPNIFVQEVRECFRKIRK